MYGVKQPVLHVRMAYCFTHCWFGHKSLASQTLISVPWIIIHNFRHVGRSKCLILWYFLYWTNKPLCGLYNYMLFFFFVFFFFFQRQQNPRARIGTPLFLATDHSRRFLYGSCGQFWNILSGILLLYVLAVCSWILATSPKKSHPTFWLYFA